MRLYPDAAHRFLQDPGNGLNTSQTKAGYSATLRSLQAHHPDLDLEHFTPDDLVAFCARPHLSAASRAGYRTRLSGFFRWAVWKELIDRDPTVGLKRVVAGAYNRPVQQNHWLSLQEVEAVYNSIDITSVKGRRAMAVVRLGFSAGLRRAEIAGLRWQDVSLDRRQIYVLGKGQKQASVYITDAALEFLLTWKAEADRELGAPVTDHPVIPAFQVTADFTGRVGYQRIVRWEEPVSPVTIGAIVKEVSADAGIKFRTHDMRRTFAGIIHDLTNLEATSAALRHANVGTTQRYLERRQDAAYQAVRNSGIAI